MRIVCIALLAAGAAIACATPQKAGDSTGPAVAAAPAGDSLQERFRRAYFQVACIANAGKDPETSFTPLRRPTDYLEGLVQAKDVHLGRATQVLEGNGFMSVAEWKDIETRLRASDPAWWRAHIDDVFIDELKRCP